jgi:hypothetical protein
MDLYKMIVVKEPIKFLGAYVTSVNLNAGWNSDASSCSLSLVEQNDDPAGLPDDKGVIADPKKKGEKIDGVKFQPPEIGTACLLSIKNDGSNFKFAGILQKYTYTEDVNSGRKWDVELTSPASFLDGVQIILGGFTGTIFTGDMNKSNMLLKPLLKYGTGVMTDHSKQPAFSPTNIINLFGFKENVQYGGAIKGKGTAGGKFGAADTNSLGYPVKGIIQDIHACCKAGIFGGKLTFAGTEYKLDLTEFQPIVDKLSAVDYRIQQNFSMNLNALLSDLASVAMYDYFIYIDVDEEENPELANALVPGTVPPMGRGPSPKGASGASSNLSPDEKLGILKKATLKVKAIDRKAPLNPDLIKNYIGELLAAEDKNMIGYKIGKEITGDLVTQKVIVGPPATRMWIANQNYMLPVWGSVGVGTNRLYFYGKNMNDYYNIFSQITVVSDAMEMKESYSSQIRPGSFLWFNTNMLEVRCALSGKETWMLYHKLFTLAYRLAQKNGQLADWLLIYNYHSPLELVGGVTNFLTLKDIKDIFTGETSSHDLLDTSMDTAAMYASYAYGTRDAQKDYYQRAMNSRFNTIEKVARECYGRKFLVAVPSEPKGIENNFRWIKQDQKPEYAWELADSAWASEEFTVNFPDPAFYNKGAGDFFPAASYPVLDYDPYWSGTLVDYSALPAERTQYAYKDSDGVIHNQILSKINNIDKEFGYSYQDPNKLKNPEVTRERMLKGEEIKDSNGKLIETNHIYGFCEVEVPPVKIYDSITTQSNAFGVLARLIFQDDTVIGKGTKANYANMFGADKFDGCAIAPAFLPPDAISIPQESTRHVWGPWWAFSNWDSNSASGATNGRKGKTDIVQDESFAPHTYGSIKKLNEVAQGTCAAELNQVHAVESGYVELAEAPKYNLTDKLMGTGPYITTMGIQISSDQIVTTYNMNSWSKNPANLARYIYKRIQNSQSSKFLLQKKIRDQMLQITKPLPPVNTALLGDIEKNFIHKLNTQSNQGIFAAQQKSLWRSINQPIEGSPEYEKFPKISAHSSSTDGAMKAIGHSPEESFGSSFEQVYSPAYIWNQRDDPDAPQHKIIFNQGLFVTRGVNTQYDTDGVYTGNDIPPLITQPDTRTFGSNSPGSFA